MARRHGYPDLAAFVLARAAAGVSLAAISRKADLHKDWLSRHLAQLDPAAADSVRRQRARRRDAAWWPALRRLGSLDVASYLRERHLVQHRTVSAMATETGLSQHAVESGLRRHAVARNAHAQKRHAASQRAAGVAAGLGYASIAGYVRERRADGWTWSAISAESGQPQTRLAGTPLIAPMAALPGYEAGPYRKPAPAISSRRAVHCSE